MRPATAASSCPAAPVCLASTSVTAATATGPIAKKKRSDEEDDEYIPPQRQRRA